MIEVPSFVAMIWSDLTCRVDNVGKAFLKLLDTLVEID